MFRLLLLTAGILAASFLCDGRDKKRKEKYQYCTWCRKPKRMNDSAFCHTCVNAKVIFRGWLPLELNDTWEDVSKNGYLGTKPKHLQIFIWGDLGGHFGWRPTVDDERGIRVVFKANLEFALYFQSKFADYDVSVLPE